MSRRRKKKTRLIYCEGAQDKAFLDCLKVCYVSDTYNVDIKRGAGGDQVYLVGEACKKGSAYSETYLKMDGDRLSQEMDDADTLAQERGITILRSTPAIEQLLVSILEPNRRIASWSTSHLKRYFEDKYIPNVKRTEWRAYQTIFTKEVLDEARGRLPELQRIIGVF